MTDNQSALDTDLLQNGVDNASLHDRRARILPWPSAPPMTRAIDRNHSEPPR